MSRSVRAAIDITSIVVLPKVNDKVNAQMSNIFAYLGICRVRILLVESQPVGIAVVATLEDICAL